MINNGFVRVAAATSALKVADCTYNTESIISLIDEAEGKQVEAIVFPEMCITGYTCGDLFHQNLLLEECEKSVSRITKHLKEKNIIVILNIPVRITTRLYSLSAVIWNGEIKGLVPKTHLPNYNEFYDLRWFAPASELRAKCTHYAEQTVPVGTDLLFSTPSMTFGTEICEDLWTPIPPSSYMALHGAEILFNSSASNETTGKHAYRKSLVSQQSARCICGYVYASAGHGESTTDIVFSGSCLIAENGTMMQESERFLLNPHMIISDVDIEALRRDRLHNTSFSIEKNSPTDAVFFRTIDIPSKSRKTDELLRIVTPQPFVPANDAKLDERCEEIFSIQVNGLAKRIQHTGAKHVVIGVSGGLDSTLALLVVTKVFDKLNVSRKNIIGITMPGFGTTSRTYSNATLLMQSLGVTSLEIPIKDASLLHFKDIGHNPDVHDITYENTQARERTQILMDYANKVNGLVIGTGDLSELALGWCTYNGDHMSMYAVNISVPKTLVRTLVAWIAKTQIADTSKIILEDVVDTPISPELLPADENGEIAQRTEDVVGPYILHDFFLYYVLRFGFSPSKIYFLSRHAFKGKYTKEEILKWLRTFFQRFISQQFKRSCLPDGPKVGSVNLSPRGDWRMPSDASAEIWMKELDELEEKPNNN